MVSCLISALAAISIITHVVTALNPSDSIVRAFLSTPQTSIMTTPKFSVIESDALPPSRKPKRPTLLYLPGLDGSGLSAISQFTDLSNSFTFHTLTIPPPNRDSFSKLVEITSDYVKSITPTDDNEKVTVVGESFGGLLAAAVVSEMSCEEKSRINLVLVNPATSFPRTSWDKLAPLLTTTVGRTPLYPFIGGGVLAATVPSTYQSLNLTREIISDLTSEPLKIKEKSKELVSSFTSGINERLPPDVVEFRVWEWCDVGSKGLTDGVLSRSLKDVGTIVMVGMEDNLLPSKDEGKRLKDLIGDTCTLKEYSQGSHFLLDSQVNLTSTILTSPLFKKSKPDPITDFPPPPPAAVKRIIDTQVRPFRTLASPKFYSTSTSGDVVNNLVHLPINECWEDGKPLLIVGNHQFGGLDLGLVIAEMVEVKGRIPRGLAHPVVFRGGMGGNNRTNNGREQTVGGRGNMGFGQTSYFETFGAVEVGPRNFYRLMENGIPTLLYPGGVREVFHGRGEEYKLFWPTTPDFIRTAAKFNATIVTLAGVGAYESSTIIADQKQLLESPIGGRLKENSERVQNARGKDKEKETFVPPISIPKFPPARHYFLFGSPIDLSNVDHKSKTECGDAYENIKQDLEGNLEKVLKARKGDKWAGGGKDGRKRLGYEAIFGERSAPGFDANDLL